METTEDAVSYTAFRFPPSGVALVLGNEETRTRTRTRTRSRTLTRTLTR